MPDFKELLNRPMDDVKRPEPLPPGTYHGIVKEYKFDESPKQKTPYCRFIFSLQGPGDDIDPEDVPEGIDWGKRTMRDDYYLTDDALYRLKEFLESLGIDTAGRSFGETIPEAVGQEVIIIVGQETSQKNPENVYNTVQRVAGPGED